MFQLTNKQHQVSKCKVINGPFCRNKSLIIEKKSLFLYRKKTILISFYSLVRCTTKKNSIMNQPRPIAYYGEPSTMNHVPVFCTYVHNNIFDVHCFDSQNHSPPYFLDVCACVPFILIPNICANDFVQPCESPVVW